MLCLLVINVIIIYFLNLHRCLIATETIPVMSTSNTMHKVFVYGTLKRGEPNHQWFSSEKNGYYKFLYEAKTMEKFPLVIGTKYNIPFILYSPGKGNHVQGEVYEVDNTVLAKLDVLEDHPNYYIRDLYDVQALNETSGKVKAWIYVIKNFKKELLNQTFYINYSNFGSHGRKYVERYLREVTGDHITEVLSNS